MIDVLTPVRRGEFVRGEVIARLVAQTVDLAWYVAPGADRALTEDEREVIGLTSPGDFWAAHKCHMVPIVSKRRQLASHGDRPYIFLFDVDVLLPTPALLGGFARAFERFESLGATGTCYHVDWPFFRHHLGCGCMMVRRSSWSALQPLRGSACECFTIRADLASIGLRTVPVDPHRLHAHQWKRSDVVTGASQVEAPCPLCGLMRAPRRPPSHRVELEVGASQRVDLAPLRALVAEHGVDFEVCFVER